MPTRPPLRKGKKRGLRRVQESSVSCRRSVMGLVAATFRREQGRDTCSGSCCPRRCPGASSLPTSRAGRTTSCRGAGSVAFARSRLQRRRQVGAQWQHQRARASPDTRLADRHLGMSRRVGLGVGQSGPKSAAIGTDVRLDTSLARPIPANFGATPLRTSGTFFRPHPTRRSLVDLSRHTQPATLVDVRPHSSQQACLSRQCARPAIPSVAP